MSTPRYASAKPKATPAPPSSPASPEAVQNGVHLLHYAISGAYLATSMGADAMTAIPKESVMLFLNGWLKNMQPRDNCEKSLLEMALISQFKAQQLMAEATTADPQRAEIFLKSAPKFLAEARKLFLAFRDYRSPAVAPQVNVVQQTFTGDQQVAVVAPAAPAGDVPDCKPSRLATLIAETDASVAAIDVVPTKSADELIVESFMATPEVRDHLKQMDAAIIRPSETLRSKEPAKDGADDEVNCVFGA